MVASTRFPAPSFSRYSKVLLLLSLALAVPTHAACSGDEQISGTLPAGSAWDLCWETRPQEGVVLSELYYTTPAGARSQVMKEAGLAQVHLRYDNGAPALDALTDLAAGGGFGVTGNLVSLTAADCVGGALRGGAAQSLCVRTARRGYAYKSYSVVKQGHALVIESRSQVGANTFIVRWRLFDDGSIEPSIGIGGQLPLVASDARYGWDLDGQGRIGVGFQTSVHWRLDFDIGADGSNDLVEQFEVAPSADRLTKSLSVTQLNGETSLQLDPTLKRSWRVRDADVQNTDGRAISYHLEPLHTAHQHPVLGAPTWQQQDLYVTRHNACERLLNDNDTAGGCASDITGYLNGEALTPADVVLWYRLNYHHLPASENDAGLSTQWHGFLLVPRDWTATNPLAVVAPTNLGTNGVAVVFKGAISALAGGV